MKSLLLFFAFINISFFAYADSIILVTDIWEPFRIEKDSKLVGIDIEIVELLEKELNRDIIISKKPWARCLKDMKGGSADLMIGLAYTDERAEYIHYLKNPYYRVKPAFFTLRDKKSIKKYKDLYEYKIGFVNGSSYFKDFDGDESLTKVALPRESMLITMLLRENIDLFIGTDMQVKYELKERELSQKIVEVEYSPDFKIDLYLGISKKSELLEERDAISKVLNSLISSGRVEEIVKKYTK